MRVKLILPGAYCAIAKGKTSYELEGETVSEVLDSADCEIPGLRTLVENGLARGHLKVFVNKKMIGRLQGLQTPLHDGDEVLLCLIMTGG